MNHRVIVIGGGHAGIEAAWAASNLLPAREFGKGSVALVTMDPSKIGAMSCNPSIGGLAKGQLVREIDALAGLMGLLADSTGIMFKVLNSTRGLATQGPRCQCDKHAYSRLARDLLASRDEIEIVRGTVEQLIVRHARCDGVVIRRDDGSPEERLGRGVVLTTGTFMRAIMHTGEARTPGGRFGEPSSAGLSGSLARLGLELGRLKTGTPPRLDRGSIDWDSLEPQAGDQPPTPFSDLTEWLGRGGLADLAPVFTGGTGRARGEAERRSLAGRLPRVGAFPVLAQVRCALTRTTPEAHDLIRRNLHRAPMYSGQIESTGPRYCPSIEDKVVRFADRDSHTVFLEPESLDDDWIYANGISTSLPVDVQESIVRAMPGCARARILRPGYAVEYDMVRPHQILTTGMTRQVEGLYLAGQINGTSGYEEAGAQGVIAGINSALRARDEPEWSMGRDEGYIGVMMDDLVCKTPVEPYRMFTSRAEHRLILRADNAGDRLTPIAARLGLLDAHEAGRVRRAIAHERTTALARIRHGIATTRITCDRAAVDGGEDAGSPARGRGGVPLSIAVRRTEFTAEDLARALPATRAPRSVWNTAFAEARYESYIARQHAEVRRQREGEERRLPDDLSRVDLREMRTEARESLERFRPRTFGQAARLEGLTPADLTLLAVLVERAGRRGSDAKERA